MIEKLTESNWQLVAAKHYTVNCTDVLEFHDDLNRIKYIKRLFKKYSDGGELKDRLILNHIIILFNVFTVEAITQILLFKLPEYWGYLKSFLMYLNYWPEKFVNPEDSRLVYSTEIPMDITIWDSLRKL